MSRATISGSPDAIVVGAGPNGLSAAVTLARRGLRVLVVEAEDEIGGGARTASLTRPGFVHDVCSAVHPLAAASPCFRSFGLGEGDGLTWVHADAPLAHPLDDGTAVLLERSLDDTVRELGEDGEAWRAVMEPVAGSWDDVCHDLLGPLRPPDEPVAMARFALVGLRSARSIVRSRFRGERARALFAGLAAHAGLPLDRPLTAAIAVLLGGLGHAVGWPFPRGGAAEIPRALADRLRDLGGTIETGRRVDALADLPPARAVLLDVTPRQLLPIVGDALPPRARSRLARWRYGLPVFKVDWALDGPIPWRAGACARAGVVHVGGTAGEIEAAEEAPWRGEVARAPFVIVAQPSAFDPTRAPAGHHVAWAYCRVPRGSVVDMTATIESAVERFAPGFRERIVARHVMGPDALERHDANLVGGSIDGGVQDLRQTIARPRLSTDPYALPARGLYLCSSSTPPGAGVHGMCGWNAAHSALRRSFGVPG